VAARGRVGRGVAGRGLARRGGEAAGWALVGLWKRGVGVGGGVALRRRAFARRGVGLVGPALRGVAWRRRWGKRRGVAGRGVAARRRGGRWWACRSVEWASAGVCAAWRWVDRPGDARRGVASTLPGVVGCWVALADVAWVGVSKRGVGIGGGVALRRRAFARRGVGLASFRYIFVVIFR
jgi:hypothetical protein